MDGPPTTAASDDLERRLAALARAADAAERLGVDVSAARAVVGDASGRLGFPGEAYVLALVGGTGVGKSSLLNALAGASVSPASVRRPTTAEPVAWIPTGDRDALLPVLEWLGVRDVREHDRTDLPAVAVVDLPDMDSTALAHRARVEALLPRVDAVAWITDPEKYHDAVLHDAFLAAWLPRLDRQAIVLNKGDRLTADDGERVRRDLGIDMERAVGGDARAPVPVLLTSAHGPGGPDIAEFRAWLAAGAQAKAVARARIAASVADAVRSMARAAGIDLDQSLGPLLAADVRATATGAATEAVLRAVDLPGLERQAVAATRARARARGTGPMGALTSLVYRLSGRAARVADPEGHLVRWRERGSLAPAVEALREAMAGPIRSATPALRPSLAAAVSPADLGRGIERAVNGAIARRVELQVPSSRWWPLIGWLQTLTMASIVLSVAWIVIWILARPPVDLVEVPLIGRVPVPFALLVGSLAVGYLLARAIGLHAGWLGRRWARRLRQVVAAAVERAVGEHGLAPLDRIEATRQELWAHAREALADAGAAGLAAGRPQPDRPGSRPR